MDKRPFRGKTVELVVSNPCIVIDAQTRTGGGGIGGVGLRTRVSNVTAQKVVGC